MKTRGWKIEDGGWRARSVLECGGPPPLFPSTDLVRPEESARGLAQSKTCRLTLLLCFIILHSSFCLRASGQYSIDWPSIDGGGGTSTGGVYSVTGTMGQPDAGGPMTNGQYSVTGGFWGFISAVQTPGAPVLGIKLTNPTAMVYWPSPSTGWNLQVNANLATTNWATPGEAVTDNGTIKYILVNPITGNRCYRLLKP